MILYRRPAREPSTLAIRSVWEMITTGSYKLTMTTFNGFSPLTREVSVIITKPFVLEGSQ